MRKSCETDASSVLRTRSVSVAVCALTISRASEARSSAAAVCSASVSSRARASESSGGPSFSLAMPTTPSVFVADAQRHEVPWDDRQGCRCRRPPARHGCKPSAPPSWRRHRAHPPAARPPSAPDRRPASSSTTTGRPRLAWISLAAPSATSSSVARPESAREFVEPPHGAHAAGRNTRLLAHAAGQRRGDDRDDQEDHQRQQLVWFGDGEGVERLDEEEIVDEKRQHRGDRSPARCRSSRPSQAPPAGTPSTGWASA